MNKSIIYIDDKVANTNPHNNADLYYYCAFVEWDDGKVRPAFFTAEQLKVALVRASDQPEDVPERHKSWWQKLVERLTNG